MTAPPLDVQTKIASETSEAFVDAYYTALQAARNTLSTFYTAAETLPDGKAIPVIAWNGNGYDSGAAFQEAFVAEMPDYTYFEVQSLDAQVLNPYPPTNKEGEGEVGEMVVGEGAGGKKGQGKEQEQLVGAVLVLVNGFVRLKEKKEGPQKGFSETLVLVPNKEYGKKDGARRWVVQNQNFRYIV